jgi:hypothetical protein
VSDRVEHGPSEKVLEGGAAALGLVRENGESVESFNDRIRNRLAMACSSVAWSCEVCGKWSHANRKPPWHTRWVESEDCPDDAVVVETAETRESDTGALNYHHRIRCGPFRSFVVVADFTGQTARELTKRGA